MSYGLRGDVNVSFYLSAPEGGVRLVRCTALVLALKKIAAFGSSYRATRSHAGAAEGCDLL